MHVSGVIKDPFVLRYAYLAITNGITFCDQGVLSRAESASLAAMEPRRCLIGH